LRQAFVRVEDGHELRINDFQSAVDGARLESRPVRAAEDANLVPPGKAVDRVSHARIRGVIEDEGLPPRVIELHDGLEGAFVKIVAREIEDGHAGAALDTPGRRVEAVEEVGVQEDHEVEGPVQGPEGEEREEEQDLGCPERRSQEGGHRPREAHD